MWISLLLNRWTWAAAALVCAGVYLGVLKAELRHERAIAVAKEAEIARLNEELQKLSAEVVVQNNAVNRWKSEAEAAAKRAVESKHAAEKILAASVKSSQAVLKMPILPVREAIPMPECQEDKGAILFLLNRGTQSGASW